MSSSEKYSVSQVALASAIMCVAALFAVAMVTEWWPIIVSRNPAHIASYHFGSESMMGHGGWKYSNPEVYAWTAFAEAIAATATLPTLWMIIVRRSRKAALALVFICAAYVGSALILGQINWATREALLSLGSTAIKPLQLSILPQRHRVETGRRFGGGLAAER
jgi:hypothetical protein